MAPAWWASGWARVHLGHPEVALAHFAEAMRLSPVDPMMFLIQTGMAYANFIAGRSEEAAAWAERAWREKPNWLNTLRIAAASHGFAGKRDRAQAAISRLRELDPEFRVSSVAAAARFSRADDLARYAEGLLTLGPKLSYKTRPQFGSEGQSLGGQASTRRIPSSKISASP